MYGLVRVTETTKGASGASTGGVSAGTSNKEKFCCVKWAPEDGRADQRTPELQVKGVCVQCTQVEQAAASVLALAVCHERHGRPLSVSSTCSFSCVHGLGVYGSSLVRVDTTMADDRPLVNRLLSATRLPNPI